MSQVFTPQPGWGDDDPPPRRPRRWGPLVAGLAVALLVLGTVTVLVWRPWEAGPSATGAAVPSGTTASTPTPDTVPVAPLVRGLAFQGAECVENPQTPPVFVCVGREPSLRLHWTGTATAPDWIAFTVTHRGDPAALEPVLAPLDAVWGREAGDRLRALPADGQIVEFDVPWGRIRASRTDDAAGVLAVQGVAQGAQERKEVSADTQLTVPAVREAAERQGFVCEDRTRGASCGKGQNRVLILGGANGYLLFTGPDPQGSASTILSEFSVDGPPLLAMIRGIPQDRSVTVHKGWLVTRHPDAISVARDNWR